MFEELGISFGTAIVILIALYFIVKWAVRNAVKEAYEEITGKTVCDEEDDDSDEDETENADLKE